MIIKTLTKEKPMFTAGKKFGWIGAGLGIDQHLLVDPRIDVFEFVIGNKRPVYIRRQQAVITIATFNSWMKGRGDKLVGVVPYMSTFSKEELMKLLQPSLF